MSTLKKCLICGDHKGYSYSYGAHACSSCHSFFYKTTKEKYEFNCEFDSKCLINKATRNKCRACRFNACLKVGMTTMRDFIRVTGAMKREKCEICGRLYGLKSRTPTCDACYQFFYQSIKDNRNYKCNANNDCVIDHKAESFCRACRYRKCVEYGLKEETAYTMQTKRKCRVCNQKSPQSRYCTACKTFFKETIENAMKYICKTGEHNCKINDCDQCRYQCCIDAGMVNQYELMKCVVCKADGATTPLCAKCTKFYKDSKKNDIFKTYKCSRKKQICVASNCDFCWYKKCNLWNKRQMTEAEKLGDCKVCNRVNVEIGLYYGGYSCKMCRAFFAKSVNTEYNCYKSNSCKAGVNICRYCRYKRCLMVGMSPSELDLVNREKRKRKGKSNEQLLPDNQMCLVCNEKLADRMDEEGKVFTCRDCRKFFQFATTYTKELVLKCSGLCKPKLEKFSERCMPCRLKACIDAGMTHVLAASRDTVCSTPDVSDHLEYNGAQCQICSDIDEVSHYKGAFACKACQMFYKNTSANSLSCNYNDNCFINYFTRDDCSACRYQKYVKASKEQMQDSDDDDCLPDGFFDNVI